MLKICLQKQIKTLKEAFCNNKNLLADSNDGIKGFGTNALRLMFPTLIFNVDAALGD